MLIKQGERGSWRLRVKILQYKYNNAFCCVLLLSYMSLNYVKILRVAQQCFYCKFVTGNNENYTYQFLKKLYSK